MGVLIGVLVGLVLLWVAILGVFWIFRPRDVPVREVVRLIPDLLRLLRSIVGDRGAPLDVRVVLVGLLVWT